MVLAVKVRNSTTVGWDGDWLGLKKDLQKLSLRNKVFNSNISYSYQLIFSVRQTVPSVS